MTEIIKDFRRERRTAAASKSPTFSTHLPHTILPTRFFADNLHDNYLRITLEFTLQSTWHSPDHLPDKLPDKLPDYS